MKNYNENITKILMELGMPCHLIGYDYVKHAVSLMLQDRTYMRAITKRLYPDIATVFDTKATRVERAIRHAIETTFNNITPETIEKYFGNTIPPMDDRPCNAHFLATIAEYYRNAHPEINIPTHKRDSWQISIKQPPTKGNVYDSLGEVK